MIYKFYDTCSLLLDNNLEELLTSESEKLVISSITLNELQNIKYSQYKDEDIKYNVRRVLRLLDKYIQNYTIHHFREYMLSSIKAKYIIEPDNDIRILACAVDYDNKYHPDETIFITNDLALKQIALLYFFGEDSVQSIEEEEPDKYSGYKEIIMSDEEMAQFYEHQNENTYGLLINEYLIIKNANNEVVDQLCWTGETFRHIDYCDFSSQHLGLIKPMKGDIYQSLFMDSLKNNTMTLVKGPPGSGKAQPNSTLIPTKYGYKKLGDITVGDKILDRFGNETTVLAVYPQGLKDNYKVTFSDGRVAYCNDEHLWSYITSKGNLKTIPLKDMIANGLQTNNGIWRYKIPNCNGVEYSQKQFDIDPYVIGVFLGDGCCKQAALTVSSSDEELVKEVANLIHAESYRRESNTSYNWVFILPKEKQYKSKTSCQVIRFQTREFFKSFSKELVADSYNKRIPNIYKYGSREQRFALLQGLMDTDGSIDNIEKGRTRYTSVNLNLIKDIQELCWSLGLSASISSDNRKEKYRNNICYILTISCPKDIKPKLFRLSRKKDIAIKYSQNDKKTIHSKYLTIKNIEKMEEQQEMTCLLVDNDEHLYLTEQYIVTHNSYSSLGYLLYQLERHKIDKIIIFCNPVAVKNSAKLGFYPGDKNTKLLDSQIGNFLGSKFGSKLEVERLIQEEKILLLPLSDARGFDTSGMRAGVYIPEAQNMDISLMKLALQRIGNDCICILDGDVESQVDLEAYNGKNNGMRRVSEIFRGHDIYGEVELKTIHRSKIAAIANDL